MKRIVLFLVTNLAVILVISIVFQLLGFQGILKEQGTELDLAALLVFAALFGMSGSVFSLLISKWFAKRSTGAHVIDSPQNESERWLVTTVQRQAQMAGIGMPEVAIYPSPDMNAFATGANRDHALVAVSSGIFEQMSRDELEAVLGHEVSHIANGDMITLSLIQGVVNTFVIFFSRVIGFLVDRLIFKVQRGHGPGFWVTVIVAQLAGKPKMIDALRRLQQDRMPSQLPDSMAAFGIAGGIGSGIKKLFMTHPPIEERIQALENSLQ